MRIQKKIASPSLQTQKVDPKDKKILIPQEVIDTALSEVIKTLRRAKSERLEKNRVITKKSFAKEDQKRWNALRKKTRPY